MERFWIIVLAIVLYALSFVPKVENFARTPADRYYFGSVDYALDFVGNLVTVREGYLGHWDRESKGTTVVIGKDAYLKIEYILIGHFSRLLRLDPLVGFFIVRTGLSVFYVVIIYRIIAATFPNSKARILAFALALFSTGVILPWQQWPTRIMDSMPGDTLVFQRVTTAMPHYLIGGISPILSLFCLARFLEYKRRRYIIFAILFGFIGTWVYAPSMLLVVATFPFYIFLRRSSRELSILFLYSTIVLLPIIYIRYLWQFWDYYAFDLTEKLVPFRVLPSQYVQITGGTYLLGLFAIPVVLRSQNRFLQLIAPWLIVHPVAVLVFSNLLNLNSHRFFFGPYFVIFGILAAIGVKRFGRLMALVIVGISYVASLWAYSASVQYGSVCFCNVQFFDYGYPKKELMGAIFWLRDHSKEADVVLSGPYAGVLIPAFAGNRVYTSWWLRLMEPRLYEQTEGQFSLFYSGGMSSAAAQKLFFDNTIGYILYSQQERQIAGNGSVIAYPFITQVYQDGETIIYRVIENAL